MALETSYREILQTLHLDTYRNPRTNPEFGPRFQSH
jgi:hypothetical protein